MDEIEKADVGVMVSAGAEWRALLPHFADARPASTPYGEYFQVQIGSDRVVFLHGGWGKVAAAGSTQYLIDRWSPDQVVNLGTCGGFAGQLPRGALILARKTIIYDIIEQMTDAEGAIAAYSVDLDLAWLPDPPPQPVIVGTMVSADRDILSDDIPFLIDHYDASVGDWESGAFAWVAKRNQRPCLILRGVTDLVSSEKGEAYGDYAFFEMQAKKVMGEILPHLPDWLAAFRTIG